MNAPRVFGTALLALALSLSGDGSQPAVAGSPAQRLGQARALCLDGQYAEADELALELLADAEEAHGPDARQVADVLDVVVWNRWEGSIGEAAETLEMARRAVRIRERLDGEDVRLATSLHHLALAHHRSLLRSATSDREPARRAFERSRAIRERLLGPEHPDVAASLDEFGVFLIGDGDLERARSFLERSLAIREASLGSEHRDVAETELSLGYLHYVVNEFDRAERSWGRALTIRESALGPEHPKVAGAAYNLALVHRIQGDLRAARSLLERALRALIRTRESDPLKVAAFRAVLADVAWMSGDFAEARRQFDLALESQARHLGTDHPEYARTLASLARLLTDTGDEPEALRLHERALAIRELASPPSASDVAESLYDLGFLHRLRNDAPRARGYFGRALEIRRAMLAPDDPLLATTMLGYALSLPPEQNAEANRLIRQSIDIAERSWGPESPYLVSFLINFGEQLYSSGEFAEARRVLDRALALSQAFHSDPDVARLHQARARALLALGLHEQALEAALRSTRRATPHLEATARVFNERQALAYAATSSESLDMVFSVMDAMPERSAATSRAAWDAVVRVRGVVLDEMASRRRDLGNASDPQLAALLSELHATRQHLANLLVRGPGAQPGERHAELVTELQRREEEQERALAHLSLAFRGERRRARIGFDDVADRVPAGSALLAFVRFNRYDPLHPAEHSRPSFVAFVLPADRREALWLSLGPATEIDRRVATWKREAAEGYLRRPEAPREAEVAVDVAGRALRETIWDPLAPYLVGARRIFIVPDSTLNLVNFAALPAEPGRFLLETQPVLHLLTAETDLVAPESRTPSTTGLLALGGADFDAALPSFARRPEQGGATPMPNANTHRALRPDRESHASAGDFRTLVFEALPATRREAEEVADLWRLRLRDTRHPDAEQDDGVVLLTGAEANESALKRLAPGRQVVHIATHGFFLESSRIRPTVNLRGIGATAPAPTDRDESRDPSHRPVLSGLALAGANHRARAAQDEDDGVLTPDEIVMLPLDGVAWVVLSACDTGLGPIQTGEGVFGLRRAFQIAGARTLIMSLWAVEDESAREWMRALYEQRWNGSSDTAAAVHRASRAVLSRRRAEGLSTHPLFWGGFIAAGDWR